MLEFVNMTNCGRVCLFSSNDTTNFRRAKCTVEFRQVLLSVKTFTVATALKKITTINPTHNLPLSPFKMKNSVFSLVLNRQI